jgi:hypothetical protein
VQGRVLSSERRVGETHPNIATVVKFRAEKTWLHPPYMLDAYRVRSDLRIAPIGFKSGAQ